MVALEALRATIATGRRVAHHVAKGVRFALLHRAVGGRARVALMLLIVVSVEGGVGGVVVIPCVARRGRHLSPVAMALLHAAVVGAIAAVARFVAAIIFR